MQLTPLAKGLIAVIVLGAAGSIGWNLYKSNASQVATNADSPSVPSAAPNEQASVAKQAVAATPSEKSSYNSYQTIVEKGVVRVSVQSPSKPFYHLENGVPKGFNVDFMRLLFAQAEFTKKHPKVVLDTDHAVDTYAQVPEQLKEVDNRGNPVVDLAIDGLTFADGDQPNVVYTVPYVSDFGYSLITGPRSAIRGVSDVANKRIGILQGDPDAKGYAQHNLPGAQLVELSDASNNGVRDWILRAIQSGKVDAVIYDYPFAVAEIANTDLVFAVSKLPKSDVRYKIGVRATDTELLQNLNQAIVKAKESEEYLNLLRKYFISNNVAQAAAVTSNESIYIVKAGDTLSLIATRLLGNKARYVEIETRNNLPNPNLIQVGQKLILPKA